jgi:HSP20 family protein
LAVDVYQTKTEIVVKAPVAGVAAEDININVKADSLTITGERKEEKEVSNDDYFAQECFWGSFSRLVSLPTEGDPEKAKATFKDGILTVRIPKAKKEHVVHLKVNS